MTLHALIVGVDPGPIPGIVVLRPGVGGPGATSIFQCDAGSALWLVREMLSQPSVPIGWDRRVLAVERFVVGPRAARSATPRAGQLTRDMIGALITLMPGLQVVQRSASEVMPWATDTRLDRAGLLRATKGMQHARAAARHALYAAVRDCELPDPLSRKARHV